MRLSLVMLTPALSIFAWQFELLLDSFTDLATNTSEANRKTPEQLAADAAALGLNVSIGGVRIEPPSAAIETSSLFGKAPTAKGGHHAHQRR